MKTIRTHVWIITAIAFLLVGSLCCGGISATFNYSQNDSLSQITSPDISLIDFKYQLTGFPDTVDGKMNQQLVSNTINAINDPNSKTVESINAKANESWFGHRDLVGNMDYHHGKDMEGELFDNTTGQDMTVLIYYPNGPESNYIVFTTTTPIVKSSNDTWFGEIYKTVLVKNADGTYTAQPTEVGWAKYAVYKQKYMGSLLISTPSFDPESWTNVDPTQA